MEISLVIPAFNEERYLGACLDAIAPLHTQFKEVIVVDNVSTDSTAMIAARYQWVTLVHESARGPANARARGLAEARGDIVAFIDADTRMPAYWPGMIKTHFQDERLACLSGPYFLYDAALWLRFGARFYFWAGMPVYWASGFMAILGNMAVRKSMMEKIGGFDLSIQFYGDDTNLAKRLSKVGKSRFSLAFVMPTSARRLHGEGVVRTVYNYAMAYFSEGTLGKRWKKEYTEVR